MNDNVSTIPVVRFQSVLEVKEKLKRDYHSLPIGKGGRDDEDMILWFLKDRKFSVNETVSKLTKAIKWRREFGVAELSEDSVRAAAKTGKSYLHDYLDVYKRPVMMVDASKHVPGESVEDEKLCVYLIEKALSKLPEGVNDILTIIDLRGFGTKNADLQFVTFLVISIDLDASYLHIIPVYVVLYVKQNLILL
ncbi:hypothetical protein AgCh_033979 [Apium graveolens]